MNRDAELDQLLAADPTPENAKALLKWVEEVRGGMMRGDMMIGILSFDTVERIGEALEAAADRGVDEARLELGRWYADPDAGEADLELADATLERAHASGVEGAGAALVRHRWYFRREEASEAERAEAFCIASELAAESRFDGEIVHLLAHLTTHGFGIPADASHGLELQHKAAEMESDDAMFELYIHYSTGLGTEVDEVKALEWCRKAAEAEHSRAMYNMGAFHATGRGVDKDMKEAVRWYEAAADDGNPRAMIGLALIYGTGDGVDQDLEYAEERLSEAEYCGLEVNHVREMLGLDQD